MADSNMPDDKLKQLEKEIENARKNTAADIQENASPNSQSADLGKAMRMGIELVSGVAVGSIAGFFLDRWLGTMPLFFIICFFLGAAAGFRNMLRDALGK